MVKLYLFYFEIQKVELSSANQPVIQFVCSIIQTSKTISLKAFTFYFMLPITYHHLSPCNQAWISREKTVCSCMNCKAIKLEQGRPNLMYWIKSLGDQYRIFLMLSSSNLQKKKKNLWMLHGSLCDSARSDTLSCA